MALAPYSIPQQPQASELYTCKHENVSVYRPEHMSIMDHIRHTHRHTKGSTDMSRQTHKSLGEFQEMYNQALANWWHIANKDEAYILEEAMSETIEAVIEIKHIKAGA